MTVMGKRILLYNDDNSSLDTRHGKAMKLRLVILAFAAVMVASVTLVSYSRFGIFLFNGGSDVFMLKRLESHTMLFVAAIVLILPALTLRTKSSVPFVVVMFLSLVIWLLCGRVVADRYDEKVATGWFCFRTSTINLYEPGDDDAYPKLWHVTALPGWRIELRRSSGRTEHLFVGPVLKGSSLDFFKARGYQVDTTYGQ